MVLASVIKQEPAEERWIRNGISITTCECHDGCRLLLHLCINVLFIFRYLGKSDSITISVWNQRKVHKKQGAGFLGCIKMMSNAINRLKDTGYQRLDLCKNSREDQDPVRGLQKFVFDLHVCFQLMLAV